MSQMASQHGGGREKQGKAPGRQNFLKDNITQVNTGGETNLAQRARTKNFSIFDKSFLLMSRKKVLQWKKVL